MGIMFATVVCSALVTLYVFTDVAFSTAVTSSACASLTIVSRSQWGARTPRSRPVVISTPVNMTFIHHSETPSSTTSDGCKRRIQSIQNYHMDTKGWNDIGYSFLICEDGKAYEGRGWNIEGSHTKGYNRVALGMCFIGSYMTTVPNAAAVTAGRNLLRCGIEKYCGPHGGAELIHLAKLYIRRSVTSDPMLHAFYSSIYDNKASAISYQGHQNRQGFIKSSYELFGHRDGGYTDCPGNALYALIKNWPNFSTRPIHKYKSAHDGNEATSENRILERLQVKNTKL